jgi:hypothetical protein
MFWREEQLVWRRPMADLQMEMWGLFSSREKLGVIGGDIFSSVASTYFY